MKGKTAIRLIVGTLVITFLILYVAQGTGYYEVENSRKTRLTDEALKRYEQDIKNGKQIDLNNYIEEEKVYTNNVTKLTSNVSRGIEKSMNKVMEYIFKEMDKAVKQNGNTQ